MNNYPKWGSIPRLYNETLSVTEKIDGTNGLIYIEAGEEDDDYERYGEDIEHACVEDGFCVYAGSRKRWITPNEDNHGFAAWVYENASALAEGLGAGHHFGEWAGPGINGNRHGLEEKTFFLFNWRKLDSLVAADVLPANVNSVPVLEINIAASDVVAAAEDWAERLGSSGGIGGSSVHPEGVVIRSDLTGQMWKYFCGGLAANETSKSVSRRIGETAA